MPLKPSGQTPTSSPPRSIRSASSLQARVAPPLRARSPTIGSRKTRSAPSGRRNRPVWSWMLTAVISPSTGTVPEWLETTRAPPSAGMFSVPRTSIRNHFCAIGRSAVEQELLGDLAVEAVVVDGEVAGQPAAQEREELREPRLPVLAEELLGGRGERRQPLQRRDARDGVAVVGGRPADARRRAASGRSPRSSGFSGLAACAALRGWVRPRAATAGPWLRGAGPSARARARRRGSELVRWRRWLSGLEPARRAGDLAARLRLFEDGLSSPVPRPGLPRVPIGMISASPTGYPFPEVERSDESATRWPAPARGRRYRGSARRRSRRRPRRW